MGWLDKLAFGIALACWTGTAVMSLFFGRCPFTIGRFVIPVVINALDAVFRRTTWKAISRFWPHVGQKIIEAIFAAPARTNCYSSSAVPLPIFISLSGTAIKHVHPAAILCRFESSPSMAMSPIYFCGHFFLQAATAFCSSVGEQLRHHWQKFSAFAKAQPVDAMTFAYASGPCSGKSSEGLVRQVSEYGHLEILPHKYAWIGVGNWGS